VALLVAISFATVGEAILVPILDRFNIINSRLGQAIIGIGTTDDLIEIAVLIFLTVFIGTQSTKGVFTILAALAFLFILTISLTKLKRQRHRFKYIQLESLFLFAMVTLLFFIGIGEFAHSAALAALLAGISLRTFVPNERLRYIEQELRAVSYGLFAPIFFIWVGATMDTSYLLKFPLLILLVVVVTSAMKLLGTYLVAHKEFENKEWLLLGTGLSVRFSTSIIIIKILFDNGLVASDLFSVIVASSIIFTFLVPIIFSNLLVKLGLTKIKQVSH
jgi:Kef-type K+ transport system membrane component KefB